MAVAANSSRLLTADLLKALHRHRLALDRNDRTAVMLERLPVARGCRRGKRTPVSPKVQATRFFA